MSTSQRIKGEVRVRGFVEHFDHEPNGAQHESAEQRRDGAGSVEARPQNSQDKADGDRRADVSLHALQINLELALMR